MKREIDGETLQRMLVNAYNEGRDYAQRIQKGVLSALGLVQVDKAILNALEECGVVVEEYAAAAGPRDDTSLTRAAAKLRNARGAPHCPRQPEISFEIESPPATKDLAEQIGLELIAGRLRIKVAAFLNGAGHMEIERVEDSA